LIHAENHYIFVVNHSNLCAELVLLLEHFNRFFEDQTLEVINEEESSL